jgi:hypothetical protein
MSASRNWYFSTAAIASLSVALDAAAEKPFGIPKVPDMRPGWAGPDFRGSAPAFVPGNSVKAPSPLLDRGNLSGRGTHLDGNMPATVNRGESGGASAVDSSSGRGDDRDKDKSRGAEHRRGKDKKHDNPGENFQASAGESENAIPKGKLLHELPTCQ